MLRDLLGQGIHHTLRLARRKERERARVHDPQALRAHDSGARVDDGHGVVGLAHFVRGARVPDGLRAALNRGQDVAVARDVCAGVGLGPGDDALDGFGGPHLARAAEGGDEDLAVAGIGQPVGRYQGENGCVVADDGHVSAGEGRGEARQKGCEVLPNGVRGGRKELVTKVCVELEVLDVGPLGSVCIIQRLARSLGERPFGKFLKGKDVATAVGQDAGALAVVFANRSAYHGGVGQGVVGHDVDRVCWAGEGIIPHILAHAWAIDADGDLMSTQSGGGPNAGDHEQLWGVELHARPVNKPGAEIGKGPGGRKWSDLRPPRTG